MKYTGPIFRPPPEANTLLLQVTVGCSHNTCRFCTMYKETPFSIERIEQIEQDLLEARKLYSHLTRLYLLNGDPFALSAKGLKIIAEKITAYFPEMETITMYASIRNIRHKSDDDDLLQLRKLGINELWVGVESGDDEVLRHLRKGHSIKDAQEQLTRLAKAGIEHNGMYMLGLAGKDKGVQHAVDTARLINTTAPRLVGVTTVGFFAGSELSKDVSAKRFIPATEREILEEQRKLIELIEVRDLEFFGDHPINATAISGILPRDRHDMLETLDYILANEAPAKLDKTLVRSSL